MRADRLLLIGILLIGSLLRFTGLNWSVDPVTSDFHRFHPDESTIIDNARWLGEDLSQVKSAYGILPVYLVYAAGHAAGALFDFDPFEPDDDRSEHLTFLAARAISATLGTLTILFIFLIGNRIGGMRVGMVAAGLLALSPGHIQQSHYYTVDASMAFWVTLALYLILRTPTPRWWLHLVVGIVVGIAGGYRFIALGLALPYIAAQLWHPGDRSLNDFRTGFKKRLRRLLSLPTLGCGLIAAAAFALSAPNLLIDPEAFFDLSDQRNFLPSVDVATGSVLRLWNLYDFTTTPYLFYITDLFPAALGSVAAVCALAGIGVSVARPTRVLIILLAWFIPYFLMTGGLFTKPIRYTTPLLPMMCCLAAYAWHLASARIRPRWGPYAASALTAVLMVPTAVHGLAVSSVYLQRNVRFEAAEWLKENIPADANVIGETGGFPTLWMTTPFQTRTKDPGSLFMRTRHHVLPGNVVDILAETLSYADYYVLIAENRAIPYVSAPEAFPLAAGFYSRLRSGNLGYERVTRFSRSASLLGYTFDTEGSDPTITAFDRPTIEVYRRTNQHDSLWAQWKAAVISDPVNPDSIILGGISLFRNGDYPAAQKMFEQAMREHPELKLAQLCRVEAIYRYQTSRDAQDAFEKGSFGQWDFAGLSLAGIPERGAEYTRITLVDKTPTPENLYLRQLAAKALIDLGSSAHDAGNRDQAIDWYEKALELDRKYLGPFRGLAVLYLEKEQFKDSAAAYNDALRIAPGIGNLWVGLAIAESRLGNAEAAYQAARRALPLVRDSSTYDPVFEDLETYFNTIEEPGWAQEIRTHLDR